MGSQSVIKSKKSMRNAPRLNAWLVTAATLSFALLVGFLAWLQLHNYEDGVIEVYTVQQDGYVQLVLDQINLIEDESDETIVNNIISTLDSSSNKYWTLSKRDALVFVKDIQETNKYKGFTTSTYFISDTAQEFIDSLITNRVTHKTIQIGDRSFIASGVQFEYSEELYRICLLTNSEIVLDHNTYLSAKINLLILFVIIILTVVIGGLSLAIISEHRFAELLRYRDDNEALRGRIQRLTDLITRNSLYDTRYAAFGNAAEDQLIDKLEAKNVWPLTYMILKFKTKKERDSFLDSSSVTLDRKVLRVIKNDNYLSLYVLRSDRNLSQAIKYSAADSCVCIAGEMVFGTKPDSPLKKLIKDYDDMIIGEASEIDKMNDASDKLKSNLGISESVCDERSV